MTWRRDKFPTYQWFPETRLANIRTGDLVMWKSLTEGEKEEEKKNTVNGQSKKKTQKKQRPLRYIIYVQMAFSRDLAKAHYWLCGN